MQTHAGNGCSIDSGVYVYGMPAMVTSNCAMVMVFVTVWP